MVPARYWFSSAKLWLARLAVVVPVERASFVVAVAAGAELAPPATRSLNWLDREKPWVAGDAITVEIAAERSLAEVGCGAEAAPVLVACCWFSQLRGRFTGEVVVVPVAGTGLVTVVVCDDVVVDVAAGRGSVTVMVCGAAVATAPVTGSLALAVSVRSATG